MIKASLVVHKSFLAGFHLMISFGCAFVKGAGPSEEPAMLVPNFAHARSVREAIQEVKMVQVGSFHEFNSWHSISQLVCICMQNFQAHL
jgi:mannose/fructose/N-acetylgalactosamine-specific phosphotransferase system component IIB